MAELVDRLTAKVQTGEPINWEEVAQQHPEHIEDLRQIWPALGALNELSRSGAEHLSGLATTSVFEDVLVTGVLGDFRILREVGKGGMGVVYEAEQISLRRRVALKVLPFAATMDARRLQRFHNEAQAAACLHHTNIVPVFSVGCERGVHFYAMQYIDGQPLSELIQQMRQREKKASTVAKGEPAAVYPTPADAIASTPSSAAELTPLTGEGRRGPDYFRKVAELGMQAAEALDHAHQLGIVHRDIKPANLLLDGRGNVWITDFGLAHIQHSEASLTLTGQTVGTPRYMSPEQALAKRVSIDHRTDVYSLGVTLYELLTLRPAFASEDRQELLRQIAFEDPSRLRRFERAIPAELEIIILKAMEKRPQDRYATAQELADDLRRWLLDQPIRARRPTLVQRARKWARRHRALVRAVTAMMLTVLLLGGVILVREAWHRAEAAQRETDQRVGAENAMVEAQRLAQQARWPQARTVLDLALAQLGQSAPAELRQSLEQARQDLDLAVRLDGIRLKKVLFVGSELYWVNADRDYAAAFREAGLIDDEAEAEGLAPRVAHSATLLALVAALDDWAGTTTDPQRRAWLLEVARRADPDPLRDRVRDPAVWDDPKALTRLAREVAVAALRPQLLAALGYRLRETGGDSVPLLKAAQACYPDDFWLNYDLANRLENPEEAIGYYRAAIALRPDASAVYNGLGRALHNRGQLTDALAAWQQAVRLEPKDASAHGNVGVALVKLGRRDEAMGEFRVAISLEPRRGHYHSNLGVALSRMGRLEEAAAEYRLAIQLDPKDSAAHNNLGDLLDAQGRWDEAFIEFQQAVRLDPKNADAHNNLGNAWRRKDRLDEAIVESQKAIQLNPKFANAHNSLGVALKLKGQRDKAIAEFRAAVQLDARCFEGHCNLGVVLRQQGKLAESEAAFRQAITLQPDSVATHLKLAGVLAEQGKLAEAVTGYHRAIELKPDDADTYFKLGMTRLNQRRPAAAEEALHKAIELKPDDGEAYYSLGHSLREQGKRADAFTAWQKAVKLKPDFAHAHWCLGMNLQNQGRFAESLAALKRAQELGSGQPDWPASRAEVVRRAELIVELDPVLPKILRGDAQPRDAAERLALAELCQRHKKLYAAAARFFREAFADQPQRAANLVAQNRFNAACSAALASCGQGKDADKLDEKERAGLRQQALDWLQADLKACRQMLDRSTDKAGPEIAQQMQHWLRDTDFAGVRGGEALARLPEAEAKDWQQLWQEVETLRQRTTKPPKSAEAEAAYRKALQLKPDDPQAHTDLGIALRTQGKLAEAEAAHRKAVKIKPDYADGYNNLGAVLSDLGELPEAVAAFRKAIELQPNDAIANYNLASILQKQNKLAEAVAACQKLIAIRPRWEFAFNKLGLILQDQRKYPEAEAAFRKAIDCKADFVMAHNNLGGVLIDQRQYEEAVAAFRKALELAPQNAGIRENLVKALKVKDSQSQGENKGGR
jgi:tetratricopeptide (TPR) repeat protein